MDVSLLNGFMPTSGQQFTVLTAASITNSGLTLSGTAAGMFSLVISPTSVILQAGLLGDFNHDNLVDTADYVVWRKAWGRRYANGLRNLAVELWQSIR